MKHYKPSDPKLKDIIKDIESMTGFDIVNKEDIVNRKTAVEILRYHIKWLRQWAEEAALHSERILMDNNLYNE